MPNVFQNLESKTVMGLLTLLAVTVGLAIAGKLTPEAVEAIKYIGTTFMAVRMSANLGENFGKKDK